MIAVIKGDIIQSRRISDPEKWLTPLKDMLSKWGSTPEQWELVWGDFFQLEILDPLEALKAAFEIKALIKSITPIESNKKISTIDVRMAIGIGSKQYTGSRVSESSGEAFIFSGESFETLKKEKITLAVKTPWNDFNRDINLMLKFATLEMDSWSLTSAELMKTIFEYPGKTQAEIGAVLGIEQNSVSGRWRRAAVDELLSFEQWYRDKLKKLIECSS